MCVCGGRGGPSSLWLPGALIPNELQEKKWEWRCASVACYLSLCALWLVRDRPSCSEVRANWEPNLRTSLGFLAKRDTEVFHKVAEKKQHVHTINTHHFRRKQWYPRVCTDNLMFMHLTVWSWPLFFFMLMWCLNVVFMFFMPATLDQTHFQRPLCKALFNASDGWFNPLSFSCFMFGAYKTTTASTPSDAQTHETFVL